MIALALTCEPELIIADEPTTALDVMVQAQVLNVMSEIVRERRVGLVIISHDLSVLGAECDRVAVMYAGRVVETGTGSEVFRHPEHPYTKALGGAGRWPAFSPSLLLRLRLERAVLDAVAGLDAEALGGAAGQLQHGRHLALARRSRVPTKVRSARSMRCTVPSARMKTMSSDT